jgi:hypothetical protein
MNNIRRMEKGDGDTGNVGGRPDGGVATSTGLSELRGFVSEREKLKESYRNNLVNVIDDVIPINMSGEEL